MDILKTSNFIKSLHDDDIEEDPDYKIDYNQDFIESYRLFSRSKNLQLSESNLQNLLEKMNVLYKQNVFKNFEKPHIDEYFCKELRFLLIVDFILSFFRIDNETFDFKTVTSQFLFTFFVNLGDFYTYMNYLDVDETLISYLKYMMTLYCIELDRPIIEHHFCNIIGILDDFFVNEILPQIFKQERYNNYNDVDEKIARAKKIESLYPEYIKTYDDTINYNSDENEHIWNLFSYSHWSTPMIERNYDNVAIPIEQNEFDNNSDTDDSYYDSDYDSDDDGQRNRVRYEKVYRIDTADPNYKEYERLFLLRIYQGIKKEYERIIKNIKDLCNECKINVYSSLLTHKNKRMIHILTILGYNIDFDVLKEVYDKHGSSDINYLYEITCKYGNLGVFQNIIIYQKYEITFEQFCYAANSRNKKLLEHLVALSKTHKSIKKQYETYFEEKKSIQQANIVFDALLNNPKNVLDIFNETPKY